MLKEGEVELLTKKRFTVIVEDTVMKLKISYMDSILHICEENVLDVEDISKYISPVIKNKLEAEAMELNLIPRGSQLPI